MGRVEAVISDFGGVLTSPLAGSFAVITEQAGISLAELGTAMAVLGEKQGTNPLVELETGRLSEPEFLAGLARELRDQLGRNVTLDGFGERYFEHLQPNEPMINHMRQLSRRGYRTAICTNNVREWEGLWRAMLPVEEIFEVVVDSAFVGSRKPEPRIYELTLEQLGVAAAQAVLVDDLEDNCAGARAIGMHAVWFQDTDQAISELEAVLGGEEPKRSSGDA
jgi:putative hydrolase of the HAD superfamily